MFENMRALGYLMICILLAGCICADTINETGMAYDMGGYLDDNGISHTALTCQMLPSSRTGFCTFETSASVVDFEAQGFEEGVDKQMLSGCSRSNVSINLQRGRTELGSNTAFNFMAVTLEDKRACIEASYAYG